MSKARPQPATMHAEPEPVRREAGGSAEADGEGESAGIGWSRQKVRQN
jgi:hypothetical protein